MKRRTKTRYFRAAYLAVLLACVSVCAAQQKAPAPAAAPIAESEIARLQKELIEQKKATSSVKRRRACKNTVRRGAALLDASPAAPNRFRVLAIMLQSQKRLLGLENSERNRDALYEICTQLAQAPDEYAKLRLEADLLLSDKQLTLKKADLKERALALAALIERYRDTPGEAKSLMIAARIAPKLEAFELELKILQVIGERFADDPVLMEFRLKHVGSGRIDVLFTGTFERADGVALRFPADQLGHTCLMVFWSQKTPGFEKYLKGIKEQASQHSGLLKIFSFNVDELPDAGEKILRGLELNWTAMRLPSGKKSQTFRTYGQGASSALLVNAYGHTVLASELAKYGHGQTAKIGHVISDKVIAHERFLAQLQSLFIGDFLVTGSDAADKLNRTADSVPQETLDAIQACFTAVPMRYRLTSEQALANYTKAEKLCRAAISQHAKAADLWRVRNRRIIALLGMWNLATEPKHLEAAAEEARTTLTATFPRGAEVAARFCLAKVALRQGEVDPKSVLSNLIKETGGTDASASAYAAATILALDASSMALHTHYREKLLELPNDNPMLWPVVSFLRDRYHTYHLLKANDSRLERRKARGYLINHGGKVTTNPLPAIELKTLDGRTLSLPKDTKGKLTLLMFIEPPADPNVEIPLEMIGKPAQGKQREVHGTLQFASNLAGGHIHKEVNVVLAFVSDDVDRIKALVKKNAWTCQVAMVPGGLKNPMVRQLGILSADRIANVFLLRRDGTIAWQTSGLKFKAAFSHGFSVFLGMTVQIELIEIARALEALERGDYREAARTFAGPFPKKKDERYGWTGPRFHGRALANMGLREWKAALVDIDTAIAAHEEEYNHSKQHPCDSMMMMYRTKATILEKLGRAAEAKAAKEYAATEATPYPTTTYELFHEKLKKLRLSQQ
jgi:hypothetical protein